MMPPEAGRVEEIRRFHEQWHAKQTVSSQSTCEGCFLLDAVARAVKERDVIAASLEATHHHGVAVEAFWQARMKQQAEENARLREALEEILRVSIVYEPADRRVENMRRTAKAALAPAPEPTP